MDLNASARRSTACCVDNPTRMNVGAVLSICTVCRPICALLAKCRGLDIELCATAGMLHDLSSYESGDSTNHAQRSAARAKELLAESGDFSSNEISAIAQAIFTHSSKDQVDDPMAELLKDADVLQHYLYNPSLKDGWAMNARLKALFAELGMLGN